MSNECMYAWIRKSDLERCNADLDRLETENAKLRAERDEWHRVAVSKQDIIDHMWDARAENDKLRELLCELYEDQCDEHDRWRYRDRMRELGIEVYK